MELKVWKCDKCYEEYRIGGGSTIVFEVGTQLDGAGDRDTTHKYADLCTACQNNLLHRLLEKRSMEDQAKLAREWDAR
jgi:hypothetical protein